MLNVFLSASVPLPTRHRRFFETADVIGIREAIKALVEFVLPHGQITTGGHPAITPLIALFIRDARLPKDRLTIFQSEFFRGRFPQANEEFADVRYTSAASTEQESLRSMRETMLRSRRFDAGVFVGGMDGVLIEAEMFAQIHPDASILPIASTGAAAAEVFSRGHYPQELRDELTYPTLFRHQLSLGA